jgi:hypothetical protein
MWYDSDYGAETADYDPREDGPEDPDVEYDPDDQGVPWSDPLEHGGLIRPATLLAAYPHF